MKKAIYLAALTAFSGLNSGCGVMFGDEGYFRSRSMDYKKAEEYRPLSLPQGTVSSSRAELYPVPETSGEIKGTYAPKDSDDIPHPQGLLSFNEEAGVEVRENDDRRWLVVRKEKALVLASTRNFVESNGFKIEKDLPDAGIIETGWLKPREEDQPGFFTRLFTLNFQDIFDKFRFTVEESGGVSKISIDQVREEASSSDALPATVEWEGDSSESSLTKVMANDLSDFIAEEQANSYRTGVLASAYANAPRTIMTWDGNGFPVLVVTLDMNRTWVAVGAALERSGLEVRDLNRSLGVYYVQRGKRDKDAEDDDEDQYQLKLLRADEGVHISVQLDDNTLAPAEEAEKLLNVIKDSID